MKAKRGIFLAPFDELSDPRLLADLAKDAEDQGWDGFFLWDHIVYAPPVSLVADPWISLSAIAAATERIRIGPLVTSLARRRVHKLARETVTLDRLSGGRLTLGVGLGSDKGGEFKRFGETVDLKKRAKLLDRGLAQLERFWSGELQPPPEQHPRIPIWTAGRWSERTRPMGPLRRAASWDGIFPIGLPGPDQLRELTGEVQQLRDATSRNGAFEIVIALPSGDDRAPWEEAGASWMLDWIGPPSPFSKADAERAIRNGPQY